MDLNFLQAYSFAALCGLGFLSLVFMLAHTRKRYDLIDSAWGPTFIVICWSVILLRNDRNLSGMLVAIIVSVWGLRLSWHILRRFLRSDHEDERYVELRKKWPKGNRALQTYVRIYIGQAVLAAIVCLPAGLYSYYQPEINLYVYLGLVLWLAGFSFEIIADKQLKSFIIDPANKGKLMVKGLWRLSRHPNYFGEITMWWGIGLIALSAPFGWIGLSGSLLITILIRYVSGVPPAEKRSSQKPGWDAYAARTRAILPLPK